MNIRKRMVMAVGFLVWQGMLFLSPDYVKAQNGNALFVESEQVIAIPSKSGNSLQGLLTVNVLNASGQLQEAAYTLPAGVESPRLVGSTVKKIALRADNQVLLPVPARGVSAFSVQFSAPLNQNGTELTFQNGLPVQKLFFVIPEGSLTVSAQGGFQTDSESINFGSQDYRQFSKLWIPANTPWTVSVALLPTAGGKQASPLHNVRVLNSYNRQTADAEAVGNLILVVLILGIGFISIRLEGRTRNPGEQRKLARQKTSVMEHWADLEAAFSRGEVDQVDYLRKRDQFKRRALELEQELRHT